MEELEPKIAELESEVQLQRRNDLLRVERLALGVGRVALRAAVPDAAAELARHELCLSAGRGCRKNE